MPLISTGHLARGRHAVFIMPSLDYLKNADKLTDRSEGLIQVVKNIVDMFYSNA
jgi:hypothetical protein